MGRQSAISILIQQRVLDHAEVSADILKIVHNVSSKHQIPANYPYEAPFRQPMQPMMHETAIWLPAPRVMCCRSDDCCLPLTFLGC